MKVRGLGYGLNASVILALLSGCTGPQSVISAPGTMQVNATMPRAGNDRIWVDQNARGRDLLYVSLVTVDVYSYPRGNLLGSLGVYGGLLCSDRLGNVFVPDGSLNDIFVYAHGAPRPKTIVYDDLPDDCAVDPRDESLAVTGSYTGGMIIFNYSQKRGWGLGKLHVDPGMFAEFCAYDDKGDLFIDGQSTTSHGFQVAELAHGAKTFTTITLNQDITSAGSIQWNDGLLAIEDGSTGYPNPAVIYRFAISGSSGTKVSTTTLNKSWSRGQFWIQGGKVIGPVIYGSVQGIGFWKFPSGGSFIKLLSTKTAPSGEAVSLE